MNALNLTAKLQQQGVVLSCQGDRLVVDAPSGLLSEEDRRQLALYKGEILRFLRDQQSHALSGFQVGSWMSWNSPLFGRCSGQVAMEPEKGWCVVRCHSVTGDLALINLEWDVRVEPPQTQIRQP